MFFGVGLFSLQYPSQTISELCALRASSCDWMDLTGASHAQPVRVALRELPAIRVPSEILAPKDLLCVRNVIEKRKTTHYALMKLSRSCCLRI